MPHDPARPSAPVPFELPRTRVGLWLATCALSACAVTPLPPATAPAPPMSSSAPQAAPASVPEGEAIARLLRYADRVRALTPTELNLEIAAIGDPGGAPERQLQLALTLIHLNQPVETARALGLTQRVADSPLPESEPLKPLARLLAQRLLEQRKIEEAMDRQSAQLRDQQRRIDQLNERLEAMRAIERSINNRPPAPAPAAPAPRAP